MGVLGSYFGAMTRMGTGRAGVSHAAVGVTPNAFGKCRNGMAVNFNSTTHRMWRRVETMKFARLQRPPPNTR
jgi:hypothetical protein